MGTLEHLESILGCNPELDVVPDTRLVNLEDEGVRSYPQYCLENITIIQLEGD